MLKPGAQLAIECPSLEKVLKLAEVPHVDPRYTYWALYGDPRHGRPEMMHKWCYTPLTLVRLMTQAGLTDLRPEPPQFHFPIRDIRVVGIKPKQDRAETRTAGGAGVSITERIDNVVHVKEKWLQEVAPAPISIKIELNSRCAYKCHFCVRAIRANDHTDMPREMFSRIMREAYEMGVEEAGLFYINEPFGVDWLPEAIAECKAIGYEYVFLTTNGATATPSKVERAMAAGLDSLKFSLNFADAQQLAEVAQVTPRTFDRVLYHVQARHTRYASAGGIRRNCTPRASRSTASRARRCGRWSRRSCPTWTSTTGCRCTG